MTLEIKALALDRHTDVAKINRLMGYPPPLGNLIQITNDSKPTHIVFKSFIRTRPSDLFHKKSAMCHDVLSYFFSCII